MTNDQARRVIEQVLHQVAPDADLSELDPADDITSALDLDSMDFLNLVVGVHEATGIDIPELDYPKVATLNGFIAYLSEAAAKVG